MALPSPFPSTTQTAGFVPAGALDTMLKERLRTSKFKDAFLHMGIALVDLTPIAEDPDPSRPFSVSFGANAQLDTQLAVGSLAKIAAMFAAFHLRDQVTTAAATVGGNATDAADVAAQITADWKPIVSRAISKPPQDFPNLKHMFDFGPASPWKPTFKDGKKDWKALEPFHDSGKATIDKLEFTDRMKLMIRFSDNMSSGSCVRDVGFQYLNGSLAADGFADNQRNGILWLGGDFGYTNTPPIMGAPPWDSRKDATWVRANAKGIASYFTLVWTNRLVDRAASGEMRDILLDRAGVGYGTYLGNYTPNVVRSLSKVGILGTVISEGVILECNAGGGLIRYAAVGLGATRDEVMKELAGIFFDCVKAQH